MKISKFILLISSILILLNSSCKEDEELELSIADFETTIEENPNIGDRIGIVTIPSQTYNGDKPILIFSILDNFGGIRIDPSNGEMFVKDSSVFDYEIRQEITYQIQVSVSNYDYPDQYANATIKILDLDESGGGKPVQVRLNEGETPWDIYQENNSLLDSLYGKNYDGGLIFYLNTNDGTGFITAENNQADSIKWDSHSSDPLSFTATFATADGIGQGMNNTTAIMTVLGSDNGNFAADLCDNLTLNGKSDWFLPSLGELQTMYNNLIGKANFSNAKYWSSTEVDFDSNQAWYRDFAVSSGQTAGTSNKSSLYAVRAVRSF